MPHAAAAQIVRPGTAQALFCNEGSGRIYDAQSSDAPNIVKASFAGPGKVLAFRICTDAEGNAHYFLRKPRPNRNGVCRLFEHEVFPGKAEDWVFADIRYGGDVDSYFDLHGWSAAPPEDWAAKHYPAQSHILAQMHADGCPPPGDDGYISVGEMTDGMLKTFYAAWNTVKSSPASFDRVFAKFPDSKTFRQPVLTGKADPDLIACDGASACTAFIALHWVSFDFTDKGVFFTGLERGKAI